MKRSYVRKIGAIQLLVWNFILVFVGVLILEIIFGDWVIDNQLFFTRIPRDINQVFDVSELYGREPSTISYTRDKYGFRGKHSDLATIDILTVGGSTTDQRYIDDADTWQSILANELNSRLPRDVVIVNAGVDGQTTYGHILSFTTWFKFIPTLKPRFILYYVGLNDIYNVTLNKGYDDLVEPIAESGLRATLKPIIKKSAFYNAWLNMVGYAARNSELGHESIDLSPENWHRLEYTEPVLVPRKLELHLKNYAERLRDIARRTRDIGGTPIFVNQISFRVRKILDELVAIRAVEKATASSIYHTEKLFAEATMQLCREVKGICLDLYSELGPEFVIEDFYDSAHNTPAGTKKIGAYMSRKLLPYLAEEME